MPTPNYKHDIDMVKQLLQEMFNLLPVSKRKKISPHLLYHFGLEVSKKNDKKSD